MFRQLHISRKELGFVDRIFQSKDELKGSFWIAEFLGEEALFGDNFGV